MIAARLAAALLAAAGPELRERLFEDGLAVLVRAPLLHVREVRLVRLVAGRVRGRLRLSAGREAAARAVPCVRQRGVERESRTGLVPVRAEEGHELPRS